MDYYKKYLKYKNKYLILKYGGDPVEENLPPKVTKSNAPKAGEKPIRKKIKPLPGWEPTEKSKLELYLEKINTPTEKPTFLSTKPTFLSTVGSFLKKNTFGEDYDKSTMDFLRSDNDIYFIDFPNIVHYLRDNINKEYCKNIRDEFKKITKSDIQFDFENIELLIALFIKHLLNDKVARIIIVDKPIKIDKDSNNHKQIFLHDILNKYDDYYNFINYMKAGRLIYYTISMYGSSSLDDALFWYLVVSTFIAIIKISTNKNIKRIKIITGDTQNFNKFLYCGSPEEIDPNYITFKVNNNKYTYDKNIFLDFINSLWLYEYDDTVFKDYDSYVFKKYDESPSKNILVENASEQLLLSKTMDDNEAKFLGICITNIILYTIDLTLSKKNYKFYNKKTLDEKYVDIFYNENINTQEAILKETPDLIKNTTYNNFIKNLIKFEKKRAGGYKFTDTTILPSIYHFYLVKLVQYLLYNKDKKQYRPEQNYNEINNLYGPFIVGACTARTS
jgi:hypothetical protein